MKSVFPRVNYFYMYFLFQDEAKANCAKGISLEVRAETVDMFD